MLVDMICLASGFITMHTKAFFVLWMAVQNKLMTQDKVAFWKPNEVLTRALCNQCPDSLSHIFFACSFSSKVWSEVQKLLNKRFSHWWNNKVEKISKMTAKNNI